MKQAKTEWKNEYEGKVYEFSHEKIRGTHVLTVNGEPIEIKGSFLSSVLGFDEGFTLDGKEARLVIEKRKPEVVLEGVYLNSGQKHVIRPVWGIVFAFLCILMPIVNLGGAIPAALGVGGGMLCINISKKPFSIAIRVILCIGVTALVWGIWFALIMAALNAQGI